jgi:hypothetical protein
MTEQSYYLLGVYHVGEEGLVILLDADKVLQVRDQDAEPARGPTSPGRPAQGSGAR